jgi:hypothetical protein
MSNQVLPGDVNGASAEQSKSDSAGIVTERSEMIYL